MSVPDNATKDCLQCGTTIRFKDLKLSHRNEIAWLRRQFCGNPCRLRWHTLWISALSSAFHNPFKFFKCFFC